MNHLEVKLLYIVEFTLAIQSSDCGTLVLEIFSVNGGSLNQQIDFLVC